MPSFSRRDREKPFPCLSSLAHALKHECHFLADVVLYVKDTNTTFPCHGLVLEARSPRFRHMLYRARCGHSHSAECFLTRCKYILELNHPFSIDSASFSAFMELLYDGKVPSLGAVSKATVFSLCEFYEVGGEVSPNAGILPSPDLVSISTKQQSSVCRLRDARPRKAAGRSPQTKIQDARNVPNHAENNLVKYVKRDVLANESFESDETPISLLSISSHDEADRIATTPRPDTDPPEGACAIQPPPAYDDNEDKANSDSLHPVDSDALGNLNLASADRSEKNVESCKIKLQPPSAASSPNDVSNSKIVDHRQDQRSQKTSESASLKTVNESSPLPFHTTDKQPRAGERFAKPGFTRPRSRFGNRTFVRVRNNSFTSNAGNNPSASESVTSTSSANTCNAVDVSSKEAEAISVDKTVPREKSDFSPAASSSAAVSDADDTASGSSAVIRLQPTVDEAGIAKHVTEYEMSMVFDEHFGRDSKRRVYRSLDDNQNSCVLVRLAAKEAESVLSGRVALKRGELPLTFVPDSTEAKLK